MVPYSTPRRWRALPEHSGWRLTRGYLALILITTTLTGCSTLTLVNLASPSGRYERTADVAYGTHPRQQLDLYHPKSVETAPVVVFFYGGGWRNGTRQGYRFVASALTKAGFAVAIPDYRLHPEVRFPEFMEDAAAAVAWVVEHRRAQGGTGEVYLMGHSAGAHIAALLALDHAYLANAGIANPQIKGLVGLSGPYDFLPLGEGYLRSVFPEPLRASSQPINFVSNRAPPTLLIHGTDDRVVQPKNSDNLAAALTEAGVSVELIRYEGMGHSRVVGALAPPLGFLGDTTEDTVRFLRENES